MKTKTPDPPTPSNSPNPINLPNPPDPPDPPNPPNPPDPMHFAQSSQFSNPPILPTSNHPNWGRRNARSFALNTLESRRVLHVNS